MSDITRPPTVEASAEEEFEGEVSGVIEAGAFVSFDPGAGGAACEGMLPVRRMRGDCIF